MYRSQQERNLFLAGQGSGKCLGRGTIIRMFDGSTKKVEDVVVGDQLMGDDNTPRSVLVLHQGVEQMYWVRQNRAMDYRVNESHILVLKQSRRADKKSVDIEITVKDWLKQTNKFKQSHMGFRAYPMYFEKEQIIDPYFFGVWLGDGSKHNSSITAVENEIVDEVEFQAKKWGLELVEREKNGCSTYFMTRKNGKFNALTQALKYLKVLNDKHIPDEYKKGSFAQRLLLLAGLIDTDGYYKPNSHGYEITQKSEAIAKGIWEVALSLGFRATIKNKVAQLRRKGKEDYKCNVYRVTLYGDVHIIPVRVPRKQAEKCSPRIDHRSTGIKIEKDIVDTYFGFTLDGNGRFLLEDFTVTHNSFDIGWISWMLVWSCPEALGLIAANTYGQLSDSTLLEVTRVWREIFGWTEYDKGNPHGFYTLDKAPPESFTPHGHVFKSNQNKIFFRNGAVVMLASLDNYKNIEGRTIAWALLDETADTKEVAVKETITGRLRGSGCHINIGPDSLKFPFVASDHAHAGKQSNPLYIFTKPAKEQWLTDMFKLEQFRTEIQEHIFSETDYFFKEYENKCVVISSSYHNVPNVPYDYVKGRERELSRDQAEMLVYGSPFGKSGVEYYSNFDRRKHVGRFSLIEGLPIHLTLDFNVNPYMPGSVWQVLHEGGRVKVRCIREYALTSPRNTIEHLCDKFIGEFEHACRSGFFYYGDATGKANLPIQEARDYYKIVEKSLKPVMYTTSRRLLRQNPRHRSVGHGTLGRREFMNGLLNGAYGVDLEIDESCKYTIADFEFCKEDQNGAKLKKEEEINGIKCQRYGHMSDGADALLCYLFGDYKKESNEKVHERAAEAAA